MNRKTSCPINSADPDGYGVLFARVPEISATLMYKTVATPDPVDPEGAGTVWSVAVVFAPDDRSCTSAFAFDVARTPDGARAVAAALCSARVFPGDLMTALDMLI